MYVREKMATLGITKMTKNTQRTRFQTPIQWNIETKAIPPTLQSHFSHDNLEKVLYYQIKINCHTILFLATHLLKTMVATPECFNVSSKSKGNGHQNLKTIHQTKHLDMEKRTHLTETKNTIIY